MLSVCSSATSTDGAYVTTNDYRAAVVGASTADDPQQLAAIVAASRWADSYLGLPSGHLLTQTYSETLPAFGGQELLLARRPLRAVTKIVLNATSTADAGATVYSSTDFRIDAEAGRLWTDKGFPWTAQMPYQLGVTVPPNSELQPWYVEYTAGYTGPGGSTTTCGTCSTSTGVTLPSDLQMGVILKAREFVEGTYALQSQKIGDLSLTYASGKSYGSAAEALLAPYRRVTV